jgi:hypothetical protein
MADYTLEKIRESLRERGYISRAFFERLQKALRESAA